MKMRIDTLRQISNQLFDHLERRGIIEVEIDKDYYWVIPDDQMYNPNAEPTSFTLGQLTDDWRELTALVQGKDPITFAFTWLAAILRFVGSKVVA